MMLNFLSVIIPLFFSFLHPFHVSVCEVEFSEKSKSIQLSQRVFLDDFEKALNERYKLNLVIDAAATTGYRDSLIQVYLFENIKLLVDGKEKKRHYIGSEIEGDAIWSYIEYEGVKKYKSLTITNTVLVETFKDQANIIHFSYGASEKSVKLDKFNTTITFVPEQASN